MTEVLTTQPNPQVSPQAPQSPAPLVPEASNTSGVPHSKQPFSRNLLIILIGVAVLLALALFGVGKINPKPKTADLPPDELLATVGDQKIYVSTVESAAKEQYGKDITDHRVLQVKYNEIVERDLLDIEAKKLNIIITDADIQNEIAKEGSTSLNASAFLKQTIKYQLLRAEIVNKQLKSVDAFVISYWIPDKNDPRIQANLTKYNQQVSDGNAALNYANQQLSMGKSPGETAAYIYATYPSLQVILGYNGNYYRNLIGKSDKLNSPTTYIYNKQYDGDSFYDSLFSMKVNEVKMVIRTDGTGGSVIKLVARNLGSFTSYSDFLSADKKQYVHTYHTL